MSVAFTHFAAPPIKQFFPQTRLLRRLKHAPRTVAMLAKCAKASYCLKTTGAEFDCAVLQHAKNNLAFTGTARKEA